MGNNYICATSFCCRALLQRISTILTAKPVSLEADYIRMKKLIIPKSKGGAGAHDRYIQKKRTENFFKNVEKTQPFYRAKVWEAQYKKQVGGMIELSCIVPY